MKRILSNILNTLFVLSTSLIFINVFSSAIPPIKIKIESSDKIEVYLKNYELKVKTQVETGIYPIQVEAKSSYPAFKIQVQ